MNEEPTLIQVKDHGHGVFSFKFLGRSDGPIYISDELAYDHQLLALIPWKLKRVGVAPWPPGVSIFRVMSDG